jgi:hypothetical protein
MKKKILACVIVLAAFSLLFAACTRSASGSTSQAAKSEPTLPNPVSTQSQLMKDIIAGTQTAMAMPVDATPADGEIDATNENGEEVTVEGTPQPKKEPTKLALPTSTAGPAPEVVLDYNTKKCAPGLYVCVKSFKKDQSVVLQATYPWLMDDMELTFKMGSDGVYDYSEYIVVGTAHYSPESAAQGFEVTLNIPDSLRGTATIVVLLQSDVADYYGTDYFTNE